ncbi:MAG: hypothetical protein AAF614_31890 [Chloroflexota bacterium]
MMNKIQANATFRLRYLQTWLSWTLAIYFILVPIIFYVLIQAGIVGPSRGSLVYRMPALVIHQFIVSAKFQEDFDYFLTFSNTRQEIFYSLGTVAIINSTLITAIMVLEKVIIDFLNGWLGYRNITDPFHAFAPYATGNIFALFFFFLTLSIALSFLGMLLGSLSYRFGRNFNLIVWAAVAVISLVYLPLAMWSWYQEGQLTAVFIAFFEPLGNFNVWATSGYLLIIAIMLSAFTFLNLRSLPQK